MLNIGSNPIWSIVNFSDSQNKKCMSINVSFSQASLYCSISLLHVSMAKWQRSSLQN